MKEFIERYSEAFALFQKYGFGYPVIYRQLRGEHSNKVHILLTETMDIFWQLQFHLRYLELDDELRLYFSCEFRLLTSRDVEDPSLLLTADLSQHELESRLVEIFGYFWVFGPDWIQTTRKALQNRTEAAREQLWRSIHQAVSFSRIATASKKLSAPCETTLLTRLTIKDINFHDDSVTQLTRALRINTTLSHLVLSYNKLTFEQGKRFARALKHNSGIILFDISNNLLGRAIKYFGIILKANTTLESLFVGSNGYMYRIANSFSKGLAQNQTLKHLRLNGCYLREDETLCLMSGLQPNHTLTSLDLSYNEISERGISEVIRLAERSLSWLSLNLNGNKITKPIAHKLAEMIRKNSSLVKLTLRGCRLRDKEMSIIAVALMGNHTLRTLDLSENLFESDGRKALTEALCVNTTLRELTLGSAAPSDREMSHLSHAFRQHPSLTSLHLNTFCLDPSTLRPLISLLSTNHSLTSLTIGHTFIRPSNTELLVSAVEDHPTLTEFNIKETDRDKKTAKEVDKIMKKNQQPISLNRQAFIYFILSLNRSIKLWKHLPVEIQWHILRWLTFPDMRKSSSQIRDCATFLFRHTLESDELIKNKQKVIVLEKIELAGHSTFRFFKPYEEEKIIASSLQKNNRKSQGGF